MSLRDKVAVVVGGGTGIGRATAILFAAEGARVAVFGWREPLLVDTVTAIRKAGGTALHVAGDVAREAEVARLDVARACLYLATDAARYVTGSVLAVDGGWTAS